MLPFSSLSRTTKAVLSLNLAYFWVEIIVAWKIGSVSLFADSIDFLEDASLNLLILVAASWSEQARARLGFGLAALLLCPGLAAFAMALQRILWGGAPEAADLTLAGGGALVVNAICAFLLARHRHSGGSLTKAAFLSARNDTFANVAIIAAGLATARLGSLWPDVIVGVAIGVLNADAAREVFAAARAETRRLHECANCDLGSGADR
jgi:Co/Zn/Cd efflux system component